jgi:hypothetical protein
MVFQGHSESFISSGAKMVLLAVQITVHDVPAKFTADFHTAQITQASRLLALHAIETECYSLYKLIHVVASKERSLPPKMQPQPSIGQERTRAETCSKARNDRTCERAACGRQDPCEKVSWIL